jgi:hypothetical protein
MELPVCGSCVNEAIDGRQQKKRCTPEFFAGHGVVGKLFQRKNVNQLD